MTITFSRRRFLELSGGLGMLAGLGKLTTFTTSAAAANDYKALVCLFMFGGNDGHNTVVPLQATQYAAYKAARQGLQLSQNQLLPISDAIQGQFGFHYSMTEMQQLYNQGHLAVLANVGTLYQQTSYAQYLQPGFPLPSQLRSHADQVVQMQTGQPDTSIATGWGGRCVDTMQNPVHNYNAGTNFPVSISMNSPALFCTGNQVAGTSSQPGNFLNQGAFGLWPASATTARKNAQNTVITTPSGNMMIDSANKSLATAAALNPILAQAANAVNFNQPFPSTSIGNQLKEIARLISLNSQLGIGRQVFFASLGAFDTHSGQSYQQQENLLEVSQALGAFYAATQQLGVDQQVTTFTMSDFGRTLQPSGSGSDHGWGNHHFIMGGAVQGGKMYGRYPLMTNYAALNSSADDYADNRGVMLPSTSLAQYGATLAQWFGVGGQNSTELTDLFPTLGNFTVKNLGFV
jgi:uncharacterized protein (DUF1501 family)